MKVNVLQMKIWNLVIIKLTRLEMIKISKIFKADKNSWIGFFLGVCTYFVIKIIMNLLNLDIGTMIDQILKLVF